MKKLLSLSLCLLLLLGLTGCGASSGSNLKAEAPMAMNSVMAGAPMEEAAMDFAMTQASGESASAALPESRKWIVTMYMDAETEALDTAIAGINEQIASIGGYVEDQSVYNGSSYDSRRFRNASLTIRIPVEKTDAFTEKVGGIANIVRKEKNLEDITLSYTATESRMKALQTEEARLLELLAQAETMSDLLEIEARLSDVRYELENYASRLRVYDNQVDYATIYLFISEVQEYTPVAEKTVWERIRDGFKSSIEGVTEGFVDFFVWVIANSPYLVVWAVVIAAGIFIAKKLPKVKIRKRNKKNPTEEK